jgi:hypothetical protein
MKNRRFSRQCICYYCTGSVLEYREKRSLAQYEDSMLEYDLTNDEDEDDENILGVGLGQLLSIK